MCLEYENGHYQIYDYLDLVFIFLNIFNPKNKDYYEWKNMNPIKIKYYFFEKMYVENIFNISLDYVIAIIIKIVMKEFSHMILKSKSYFNFFL